MMTIIKYFIICTYVHLLNEGLRFKNCRKIKLLIFNFLIIYVILNLKMLLILN